MKYLSQSREVFYARDTFWGWPLTRGEVGNLEKDVILGKSPGKKGWDDLRPGGLTSSKRKWALR